MADVPAFAGVDVGGRRKGFDVAIVDACGALRGHRRGLTAEQAVAFVLPFAPLLVGIDSPCSAAPPTERTRAGERSLNLCVCRIRWTPAQATLDAGMPYYDWIRRGLELYAVLAARGVRTIEVFPTASWTRWHDRRGRRRRSVWSREALATLGVDHVPEHTSQDLRDAIAAAVTAYQSWRGETECFGEIVVPKTGCVPQFARVTPAGI
jgi:predicted nuclease with RNAse H fold